MSTHPRPHRNNCSLRRHKHQLGGLSVVGFMLLAATVAGTDPSLVNSTNVHGEPPMADGDTSGTQQASARNCPRLNHPSALLFQNS